MNSYFTKKDLRLGIALESAWVHNKAPDVFSQGRDKNDKKQRPSFDNAWVH